MRPKSLNLLAKWPHLLGVVVGLAGCTGEVTGDSGRANGSNGPAGPGSGGVGTSTPPVTVDGKVVEFAPAAGSFKRLTDSEFRSSLQALLGPVTISDLEPDTWVDGFAKVGASQVSISLNGVEKYQLAIDAATREVFADSARRDALLGCTPQSATDSACFNVFIARFGRMAWRRPLSDGQLTRFGALASSLATTLGNPLDGLRETTNALLLSPNFLYRLERGEPDTSSKWWRYGGYELASSLAFFLTNTTPDSALLDAAGSGTLATVEGIRSQAERLLASPAGRASAGNFATELFRLAIIAGRAKDPARFPGYTPGMQAAMAREVPALFESLVFDQHAPATSLYTTKATFVNLDLAQLYGLSTTGLTADSWQPATLPADGLRAGLLGTGAFLSLYANQKEGSPTQRGKFIRQFLLCQEIPDPPANVSTVIEDPPPGVVLTKRQKLEQHRTMPTCAGCHSLMDPLGLTLENFDAIGGFRDNDQGLPIDVSGDLDGQAFSGPLELGQLLSQSEEASACMAKNLYRYATGRPTSEPETPVLVQLAQHFTANNHDFTQLMLDLVTSDGFRYVAPGAP